MKTLRRLHLFALQLSFAIGFALLTQSAFGQAAKYQRQWGLACPGKPVTVPVTIRVKEDTETRVTEHRPDNQ